MSLHSNLIKLATQPWTGNGVTSITTPASSGITLSDTVNDVEIENSGVRSLVTSGGSSGITLTGNANDIIIRNGGVHAITAGTAISLTAGPANHYEITNTGVTGLTAGSGITLSGSTGNVTVSASGGSSPNPPVFIDNFTNGNRFITTVANTTYMYLSQPIAYDATFILPRLGTLAPDTWIEIIFVMNVTAANVKSNWLSLRYNATDAIGIPGGTNGTNSNRLFLAWGGPARGNTWFWNWNGFSYTVVAG